MAFSFSSSAPAFGTASASAPSFGFGSAPAFGAPSSTPAFGAPQSAATPAFSFSAPAAQSSPALSFFGGSQPTSTFGASSSAIGASQQAASLFGGGAASSASASQPSTALTLWAGAGQPQQQQQQQPAALTYAAKFDDLHPNIQKELLDIQTQISRFRDDCEKLDREQRLHDSAALKKVLEQEAGALKQALQGMLAAVNADNEALGFFREKVMLLLRSTESAVRTFQRSKLWRDAPALYRGQQIPPQVQELLSAPVQLPSPYLEAAVQGFMETLGTYREVVSELEAALPPGGLSADGLRGDGAAGANEASMVSALPTIVSHLHDYFVHVAAILEMLHNQVESAKTSFLAAKQAAGDLSPDPFQESRRLEAAAAGNGRGKGGFHSTSGLLSGHGGLMQGHPGSHHHHHHHHSGAQLPGTPTPHQMHVGTAHGPGAMPTPGAFGTPLPAPFATPAQEGTKGKSSSKRR